MTNASMGHQAKLGVKKEVTYGTAVIPDIGMVFVSESVGKHGSIVERDGIRGTRSHNADDTRTGPYSVGGQIVVEPNSVDLAFWLEMIMGAYSAPNATLAETVGSFTMQVDRVAKVFAYTGCKVSRATFSGGPGQVLRLEMDIVAQKEGALAAGPSFTEGAPGNSGTFPSLTPSVVKPFMFHDCAFTLQSAARETAGFVLTIDNSLLVDRFMNSTTIINAPEGDRFVTLQTTHAYASGNTDLYAQALAGAAGTLVATGVSPYVLTFTFGALQVPDNAPVVSGKGEIPLILNMVSRMTGSTRELAIINATS